MNGGRDVASYVRDWASRVEERLNELVPAWAGVPASMPAAMRYSLLGGGKRLRPVMAIAAAEAVGREPSRVRGLLDVACAIEMIHTYSLIHDDLPCMDDDDFRRGKPTNHRVYGEAVAVLAGDALLTLAFEVIGRSGGEPRLLLGTIAEIARQAGAAGMVGGQVMDIEMVGKPAGREEILRMHSLKTACMFSGALAAGGIVAGASDIEMEALRRYGADFGAGFQLADDADDAVEARSGKASFISVASASEARELACEAFRRAAADVEALGDGSWVLRGLAGSMAERVAKGAE